MAKSNRLLGVRLKIAHNRALRKKKREFKKKGKVFKEHGGGVVPQEYYDSLRGK